MAGFLLSVPPGPATAAVMARAGSSRKWAYWGVLQVLFADAIVIIATLFSFKPLVPYLRTPWFKIFAGIFLMAFAVQYFVKSKTKKVKKFKSPFRLVLTNPSAWLGTLTVITIASVSNLKPIFFVIFFEIGVLLWFTSLIEFLSRCTPELNTKILHTAVAMIGLSGFILALYETLHLAS